MNSNSPIRPGISSAVRGSASMLSSFAVLGGHGFSFWRWSRSVTGITILFLAAEKGL